MTAPGRTDGRRRELLITAVLGGVLAVVGALAGLAWAAWTPAGPRALVVKPGAYIPEENEKFVAADGRYLLIVAVVAVVATLVTWFLPRTRGVLVFCGLVVGTAAMSLVAEGVGQLAGGGTYDGKANTVIAQLPLTVHARGLFFVAPALAALLYGLLVAFAVRDDLGRDDMPPAAPYPPPELVAAGHQPQDGGRDGDAPGALQQGDLPPQ